MQRFYPFIVAHYVDGTWCKRDAWHHLSLCPVFKWHGLWWLWCYFAFICCPYYPCYLLSTFEIHWWVCSLKTFTAINWQILAKYLPIGMFYVSTYVNLPFDDFFVIIFIAIILLLSLSYMSILSLSDLHSFIRLKHGIGNSRRSIFLFCQTITSSCLWVSHVLFFYLKAYEYVPFAVNQRSSYLKCHGCLSNATNCL